MILWDACSRDEGATRLAVPQYLCEYELHWLMETSPKLRAIEMKGLYCDHNLRDLCGPDDACVDDAAMSEVEYDLVLEANKCVWNEDPLLRLQSLTMTEELNLYVVATLPCRDGGVPPEIVVEPTVEADGRKMFSVVLVTHLPPPDARLRRGEAYIMDAHVRPYWEEHASRIVGLDAPDLDVTLGNCTRLLAPLVGPVLRGGIV